MRDFGKVYTQFWASTNIRELSEDGRLLAIYLLTCPHGTIAGVFRLPDGYACEDLQWSSERVSKGFHELFRKGFANRCETTNWVWVLKHFEWNALENPNQRKSAVKVCAQIPEKCAWRLDFMRVCGPMLGIEVPQTQNPSETLSEGFLNQEQEQEQEKEQEKEREPNGSSSSPKAIPDCPHGKLIDLFAIRLAQLPQPRKDLWNGPKSEAMRSRWRWVFTAKHPNGTPYASSEEEALAWFDRFFAYVEKSDFLTGRNGAWTKCNLAWLMKAENFTKVLERNYENDKTPAKPTDWTGDAI